jgi:hypothetical protein
MCHCHDRQNPPVELADVFRMHGERYCQQHVLTPEQHKVMHAIVNCRTAVLGGHVDQCDYCGELCISYNSCGNRHCPKCQSLKKLKWLENRRKELLPVQYFHLVFTVPHELNHWVLYNKELLYGLLFRAVWETIRTLGQNPKRLGGLMGMLAILHTWGQNLSLHNHLHCIVPGGALVNGRQWKSSKKGYLFPVKVISKIFRGIYVSHFRALYKSGQMKRPNTQSVDNLLDGLMQKDWVVYAKEPFAGPEKLLDYLGRYTHKIAISNHRLLTCDENSVTFKWRDYSDHNQVKVMQLSSNEFIRRFLQHVVPTGFMRIRSFGFLANACKAKNIEAIRKKLSYTPEVKQTETKDIQAIMLELTGMDISLCPFCKKGYLRTIGTLPNALWDTS